jgi:8-oxo-dGTP pyrophosphatase MutT (NUDIX family)
MGRKEACDTNPLNAAKRELREEIGLSATKWTHISTHHNGIHEEGLNYFYVAENLSSVKSSLDIDEDIEKIEMKFEEAFALMNGNEIPDLRTRACIWAGYIYLLERKTRLNKNTKQSLLNK